MEKIASNPVTSVAVMVFSALNWGGHGLKVGRGKPHERQAYPRRGSGAIGSTKLHTDSSSDQLEIWNRAARIQFHERERDMFVGMLAENRSLQIQTLS